MEKINKKLTNIEKTLNKMKKEISTIKTITCNTKAATNSCNNSINLIKKNDTKNILQVNSQKNKKQIQLTKNYFQLTNKEKKYYENKNRLQNPHSFNLKKKKPDIYSHIVDYSTESNYNINSDNTKLEKEKIKENVEKKTKTIYSNHGLNKYKKFNRILMLNEEINENKKNDDNSFENNFEFESHNIFFDYKSNGNNKCRNRVFSNIMKKNKSENKNFFNNFTVDQQSRSTKALSRKNYTKLYNSKYDNITNNRHNIIDYDFNDLINSNNQNINSENKNKLKSNINISYDYNSLINKNIGNKYYIINENNKSNYINNKNNKNNNNLKYKYKYQEFFSNETNESNIDSKSNYEQKNNSINQLNEELLKSNIQKY